MYLDSVTLVMVGSLAAGLAGIWLLWTRLHADGAPALSWWAAAYILYAIAIAGVAIGLVGNKLPTLLFAALLHTLVPALIWGGARRFSKHNTPLLVLIGGALLWIAAEAIGRTSGSSGPGAAVTYLVWVVYLAASTWELWRGRGELLPARQPLMALLMIHATVYIGGVYGVLTGTLAVDSLPPLYSWIGIIYVEGMVFSVGSALFMSKLCAERDERMLRDAARIDTLTGTANRGAFFDSAERIFRRCQQDGTPVSVIMFDLDRFKLINDTHGHRTGDKVLRIFADTVRGALRPNDLLGRYGGEEFVVVLPDANIDVAFAIAERVRHAFADAGRTSDEIPYTASVSAGVAASARHANLDEVLSTADAAMYHAKRLGRDRVERAVEGNDGATRVIRVA